MLRRSVDVHTRSNRVARRNAAAPCSTRDEAGQPDHARPSTIANRHVCSSEHLLTPQASATFPRYRGDVGACGEKAYQGCLDIHVLGRSLMKTLVTLIAAACLAAFVACTDDNNGPGTGGM